MQSKIWLSKWLHQTLSRYTWGFTTWIQRQRNICMRSVPKSVHYKKPLRLDTIQDFFAKVGHEKQSSEFMIPTFHDYSLEPKIAKCGDLLYLLKVSGDKYPMSPPTSYILAGLRCSSNSRHAEFKREKGTEFSSTWWVTYLPTRVR